MGIEKSHHEKIFRKYHRVNRTQAGYGIGLYLVKEIIQTSGGMIEVQSEPDQGTEMKVFIRSH